ncbi:tRNA (adenosine(37)-N6)-threonylcarbamoyltransferase complex ATPase subunit type 1 TsaE [Candidatus Peregrinibacteria bacterium]|jgi:tRNA threonylcarbamoyladenosine biosynthesis protein TsaE|nr:tRNA (adenosine(37)-N6)-threonylcarbamoyltransferase complex ATPase subunit type 1 TsaE [Candidatus Peregrinibacteria bacterium]MBT7484286.1 tRNA (adenosine(37)-N6)-threonylcarbamoyltransferase complex ATPase subunit type 1 TsaE [Candidatus Peregrinibacteria bacterium]MBT7703820.1 tRNA (adenosine(37)-N6)-threonylcarbamoyltransferase complex ATPase subunit type 1 TsaE [Candidatus Peregrinibacteria bacterium]
MERITLSPEETLTLGGKILQEFPNHQVICLIGPLGSGKTCFAKGVGEGLGLDHRKIKSPTFTTVFEHSGEHQKLVHCDFYRYEKPQDLDLAWWDEITENPNQIMVIEWADRIQPYLPTPRLEIVFKDLGNNQRKLKLTPFS